MNNLQQYFLSHFNNKQELYQRYGKFTDVILHYVRALDNEGWANTDSVDRLLNTYIFFCSSKEKTPTIEEQNEIDKEHDPLKKAILKYAYSRKEIRKGNDGYQKLIPLADNIAMQQNVSFIFLLPMKQFSKFDNGENAEEILNIILTTDSSKLEKYNKKINLNAYRDYLLSVLIHELNHACCSTEITIFDKDGPTNLQYALDNDFKSFKAYLFCGNIPIRIYIFNDTKNYDTKTFTARNLIHEGITEFLAYKYLYGKDFADLISVKDRQLKPSYNQYVSLITLLEISENKLFSKSYYQNIAEDEAQILATTCSLVEKTLCAEDNFQKIDNNTTIKEKNEIIKNFANALNEQLMQVLYKMQNIELDDKQKNVFLYHLKNFIENDTWINQLVELTKLQEDKDKKELKANMQTFLNELKENKVNQITNILNSQKSKKM